MDRTLMIGRWARRNTTALVAYTMIATISFMLGAGVVFLDLITHGKETSVFDVALNVTSIVRSGFGSPP